MSFGFVEFLKMCHFLNDGFIKFGREGGRAPPFWGGFEIKMAEGKGETPRGWAILETRSKLSCGILNPPKFGRAGPLLGKVFEIKMAQKKGETSKSRAKPQTKFRNLETRPNVVGRARGKPGLAPFREWNPAFRVPSHPPPREYLGGFKISRSSKFKYINILNIFRKKGKKNPMKYFKSPPLTTLIPWYQDGREREGGGQFWIFFQLAVERQIDANNEWHFR